MTDLQQFVRMLRGAGYLERYADVKDWDYEVRLPSKLGGEMTVAFASGEHFYFHADGRYYIHGNYSENK